jgi:hypothetical protein
MFIDIEKAIEEVHLKVDFADQHYIHVYKPGVLLMLINVLQSCLLTVNYS